MSIYIAVSKLFELIQFIIFLRILLSWFPNINWWQQPFKLLNDITEPMLAPFRRLIPPLSGIDLSPLVLFFVIGLLQKAVLSIVAAYL